MLFQRTLNIKRELKLMDSAKTGQAAVMSFGARASGWSASCVQRTPGPG
jgi:hypothetical protein